MSNKNKNYLATNASIFVDKKIKGYIIGLSSKKEIEVSSEEALGKMLQSVLQNGEEISFVKPIVFSVINNEVGDYSICHCYSGYTSKEEFPWASVELKYVTNYPNGKDKVALDFRMQTVCKKQEGNRIFLDMVVKLKWDEASDSRYPSIDIHNFSVVFNTNESIDANPNLLADAFLVGKLFEHYLSMCESLNAIKVK